MEHLKLSFEPIAHPEAIMIAGNARFTVLTSRLIRIEYSPDGGFEDKASQVFWYRRQDVPDFECRHDGDRVKIRTRHISLSYTVSEAGFTPDTLRAELHITGGTWHYGMTGDEENLLGTTRTLDNVSGQTALESGLLSRTGYIVIDDSDTLVFDADGWLQQRPAGRIDLYLFHYGTAYQAALDDYFRIAGKIPLLPRWVLGNWWSRYWPYTQEELTSLMQEFQARQVPLSVCIVDMDWHLTETGNAASGWTGYTWNRALFPDPAGLIRFFHDMGLRTALNLHPADGVWPHEEQYPAFAAALGQTHGEAIPFDIADPHYAQAYFELLHHPHEAIGVDFWWMDWQQGKHSGKAGLDPLWWLNHLHFYDLGRDGRKRPFVFSRWGGLGNHRYPIGFSGDTLANWDTLAYQPYFTATAANVGYGWWSHDVGGHYRGRRDTELYVRWVQYGVFSPIFRLHSTKNRFDERLPWAFGTEAFEIVRSAMQLRHALIPYLYTMSWRAMMTGQQPIVPMYHLFPDLEAAYHCPDQYTFGSELIAAPQVTPADPEVGLARQVVWMPPGNWFNFFTGEHYSGDHWYAIYSALDEVPVFAKAGAIIPLAPIVGWGGVDNPAALNIYVFPGDGEFTLYEDDGLPDGAYSTQHFNQAFEDRRLSLRMEPTEGQRQHLPAERVVTFFFRGIGLPDVADVVVNGRDTEVANDYDPLTETYVLGPLTLKHDDLMVIELHGSGLPKRRDRQPDKARQLVEALRLDTLSKQITWDHIPAFAQDFSRLSDVLALLTDAQIRAFVEVLAGVGMHQFTHANPRHQPVVIWNRAQGSAAVTYQLSRRVGWKVVESEGGTPSHYHTWDFTGEREWRLSLGYAGWLMITLKGGHERTD